MTHREVLQTLTDLGFKPDVSYGLGFERGNQWANIHGDGVTRRNCAVTVSDRKTTGRGCPVRHFEDADQLRAALSN